MRWGAIVAAVLLSSGLSAAFPVTHIIMAQHWIDTAHHYAGKAKRDFFAGSLFPDIRYLGAVSRESTHEAGVTLDDVYAAPTPFRAGARLHAWVDEAREEIAEACGIYAYIEPYADGNEATLLKMVEDEIFFGRLSRMHMIWDMAHIPREELQSGISKTALAKWHTFLTLYFTSKPSQQLAALAKGRKPFLDIPAGTVKRWSKAIPHLARQPEVRAYVERLEEALVASFFDSARG